MKVAIAGAGAVGRSIARELIRSSHDVMLIERKLDHIEPESVPEAKWVHADACELSRLEDASMESYEVVIAATGDDKANLVLSLLAKNRVRCSPSCRPRQRSPQRVALRRVLGRGRRRLDTADARFARRRGRLGR